MTLLEQGGWTQWMAHWGPFQPDLFFLVFPVPLVNAKKT